MLLLYPESFFIEQLRESILCNIMSQNQFIIITILSANPPMKPIYTTLPIEHAAGHRTPRNHPRLFVVQVPLRPLEKCRMQESKSTPAAKGKQTMKKQRKEKAIATPPCHEEKEECETRNLLPPYIPPRRTNVPWVTIPIKGSTTLVTPKIPKGMTVLLDIMPQL